MKSRIVVRCSCGKEWADDNTPEAAKSWWKVLDAAHPELVAKVEKDGNEKTLELALRLIWARHSLYRKDKGDKDPHEARVIEETIVEDLKDVKAIAQKGYIEQ